MTDKDKRITTPDESDPAADPTLHIIFHALAEKVLPPFEDDDLETSAEALTDADRKALAALGSSGELVARIAAEVKANSLVQSQAESPTRMVPQSTTATRITGPTPASESDFSYDELMENLGNCKDNDVFRWSCDYRNKGIIGQGGQGTVFLTVCPNEQNLPKALKVFSPEPYGDTEAYRDDMERMAQVASLAYRIQVDNLVAIERFACREGIWLMFMRWINGYDLARLLQPGLLEQLHGCVAEDRWNHLNNVVVTTPGTVQLRLMPGMAVNIIEKCLRGLDALHRCGVVHGDIKPSNIMLDLYGSIRLVDIGSAFELSAPPRRHTWTPQYAPPEFFESRKWTPQSDLASLGYVLIELLSGQPAVACPSIGSASTRTTDSDRDERLLDEKRRLPDRLDELMPANVRESAHLMNLCRQLIDPDPQKRFPSAEKALEGPAGTYQFLQGLTRMGLAVYYAHEIKRWLGDVEEALC